MSSYTVDQFSKNMHGPWRTMGKKNIFYVKGEGKFEYKVISKTVHQRALKLMCGDHLKPGQKKDEIAILKFQGNHYLHDHDVIIEIGKQKVGYLGEEDKALLTRNLNPDIIQKQLLICNAKIIAEDKKMFLARTAYRVFIDLPVNKYK